MSEHLEAVKVHIAGSDVPLTHPAPAKPRRGVALRTFVLTSSDPVQQILPLNANRCEAYIQTTANDITLYSSKADAMAGGNAGITVPKANTMPYPLRTTDPVWATAAVLPTAVYVSAIIEGD